MKKVLYPLVIVFTFVMLLLNMKVHPGGFAYYQQNRDRHVGGPFESSGSTSRYALVESLVNNGTVFFNDNLASFASPDVGGSKGKYFTIFAPGVSFVAYGFYSLGQIFGMEQFFAYMTNVIFAVANLILIILITRKYGFSQPLQFVASFIFIFATNAIVYSVYFTQHMLSTFCILLSILITLYKPNFGRNILLGAVYGAALLIDIPNAIMLLPAILYQFARHFDTEKIKEYVTFNIRPIFIFMAVGLLPVMVVFSYYNREITGSPFLAPQFVGRTVEVEDTTVKPGSLKKEPKQDAISQFASSSPFQSRYILNGLYILLISDERGWLYYSPILFLGILGIYVMYAKKEYNEFLMVPLSIILINILLYSMFGDPWGGWSFGPRYLIPAAAVVSILLPFVIRACRKNVIVLGFMATLIVYSIFVNTLGTITTTEVPPKQEAEQLTSQIPYTYQYNLELIDRNESYSLLNQYILPDIHGKYVWIFESGLISLAVLTPFVYYVVSRWKEKLPYRI